MKKIIRSSLLAAGLFSVFQLMHAGDAHAYIDPGTGSYFIQIAIAALVGALFALKLYWNNFKNFFKNLFSKRGKG